MHKTAHRHSNHSNYDLYDDLKRIKSALKDTTWDLKGRAEEKSEEIKDNLTQYIEKKPFKSVGIAILTGIALGFFLRK